MEKVDFDDHLGRSRAVVFGVEVERLSGKVVEPLHRRPVAVEIFENSKRTDRRGFVVRSDHERADGIVYVGGAPLLDRFPLFVLSQGVSGRVGHTRRHKQERRNHDGEHGQKDQDQDHHNPALLVRQYVFHRFLRISCISNHSDSEIGIVRVKTPRRFRKRTARTSADRSYVAPSSQQAGREGPLRVRAKTLPSRL